LAESQADERLAVVVVAGVANDPQHDGSAEDRIAQLEDALPAIVQHLVVGAARGAVDDVAFDVVSPGVLGGGVSGQVGFPGRVKVLCGVASAGHSDSELLVRHAVIVVTGSEAELGHRLRPPLPLSGPVRDLEGEEYPHPIGGAVREGLDLAHVVLRLGHGVRPVAVGRVVQSVQLGAQDGAAQRAQRMTQLARLGIERGGFGDANQFLALLASKQRRILGPKG
jgi:hypothetical protein